MAINDNIIDLPVTFELAQRFIADFNFLSDYRERNYDFYMNSSPSPVFKDVFILGGTSLLESSEMLLEALFYAYPAEFNGYCSNISFPSRKMNKKESKRLSNYLLDGK